MTIHACRTVLLEAQGAVKLKKNNRLMCSEIDYNNGVIYKSTANLNWLLSECDFNKFRVQLISGLTA